MGERPVMTVIFCFNLTVVGIKGHGKKGVLKKGFLLGPTNLFALQRHYLLKLIKEKIIIIMKNILRIRL